MLESDLEHLTGGESPFDDWGPVAVPTQLSPALDDGGGLTVDSDGVAGFVGWHFAEAGPNPASRFPNVGIWLRSSHRGRGIGSVAQQQLAELFFLHSNVNRVEATTDVENVAECRALEHAGFSREGVLRGAQWRRGAYHDMVLYSVLREDLRSAASPTPAGVSEG